MNGLESDEAGPLLALTVGGRRYGVPTQSIREVARLPSLTHVPNSPKALLGLANVRGVVTPVMSLARLVGQKAGPERRLVMLSATHPIGIAVDTVAEIFDAQDPESSKITKVDAAALAIAALGQASRKQSGVAVQEVDRAVEAISSAISLVTFTIGPQTFAFTLEAVDEVLRLPADYAAMPNADVMVLGSFENRGALLPLLLLSELLQLPGERLSEKSRVIVVRIGSQRVGLVVDGMHSIIRVAEADIDPVPLVLTRGEAEARIQAVCRLGEGKLVSVLAPRHLLREDITAQLTTSAVIEQVASVPTLNEAGQQFMLFCVGDSRYGLPISAVEQVVALPSKLTRLPRSPNFILGVMALNGDAILVIDQSKRFGLARDNVAKQRLVVVNVGDLRAAFLVDSVSEVRRVPLSHLHDAPDLGKGEKSAFHQVIKTDRTEMILVVRPSELLDHAERDLVRAISGREPVLKP